MNDKIKEILDFKEDADYKRLSIDEITILRDCITNLHEENKRLKVQLGGNKSIEDTASSFFNSLTNVMGNFMETELDAFEKQNDELNVYKLRNEKAIEHLKEVMKDEEEYEEDYIYNKYLLDILQGSDKE